ncbi:hypothetical protein [Micromonospora cremea]|uniref:hypothetical protein n=1 Tax=Micromonospora cremea TaxID=709881 RepID=UPI001AD828CF|nr:hypothetical protein [Micromonospora cremea]
MVEQYAAERAESDRRGVRRDKAAVVRDQVGPALAASVDPASPQDDPVVAAATAQ